MPWKNGGGITTEIAIGPAGATLDNFDWRVSVACIETAGPFSSFSGIDRTLAVLSGAGLTLDIEGRAPLLLHAADNGVAFPGELRVVARLEGAMVKDVNVMTRRERCHHLFERVEVVESGRIHCQGDSMLVLLVAGAGVVVSVAAAQALRLQTYDAILSNAGEDDFSVTAEGTASFCVVHLSSVRPDIAPLGLTGQHAAKDRPR